MRQDMYIRTISSRSEVSPFRTLWMIPHLHSPLQSLIQLAFDLCHDLAIRDRNTEFLARIPACTIHIPASKHHNLIVNERAFDVAFHLRTQICYVLEIADREVPYRTTLFDAGQAIITGVSANKRCVALLQAMDAEFRDGACSEELLEDHHAAVRDDFDVHASCESGEESGEHGWGGEIGR